VPAHDEHVVDVVGRAAAQLLHVAQEERPAIQVAANDDHGDDTRKPRRYRILNTRPASALLLRV
jgi:hypothetical protein